MILRGVRIPVTVLVVSALVACRGGTQEPPPEVPAAPIVVHESIGHTTPVEVVQAVLDAARTGENSALPLLCDPQDEHDADARQVCSLEVGSVDWGRFALYFSSAVVLGEAEVDSEHATVRVRLGPGPAHLEQPLEDLEIGLVNRGGGWFLLGW